MTFLYFAYGSNMLPARLRARCPSARVVGLGEAVGFDLEFSKVSQDGSGKATLREVADIVTPGVLFEIAATELIALDKAEGLGVGYDRLDDFVIKNTTSGAEVSSRTYVATAIDTNLTPYDWYLALVIAGACKQGLDGGHIERLRGVEYRIDAKPDRKGRSDASAALRSEGFDDYRLLLRAAG